MSARRTFVLVDGENIDATLGNSVLGRRPTPEERPRWERITDFAGRTWRQPVTGLFFLNASNGSMPTSFVQALLAMDYRPIPLAGDGDEKVVDVGIQRTLVQCALAHQRTPRVPKEHEGQAGVLVANNVGQLRNRRDSGTQTTCTQFAQFGGVTRPLFAPGFTVASVVVGVHGKATCC